MRLVVQRVKEANVAVEGKQVGSIQKGFLVFVGVGPEGTEEVADYLVKKLLHLRIFRDENEKMNLSIQDIKGELLLISQFTLYADCTSGNRPSFIGAAKPELGNKMYEYFIQKCKEESGLKVEKGIFGADMKVSLIKDGPVTILLEKEK